MIGPQEILLAIATLIAWCLVKAIAKAQGATIWELMKGE
jgi:hypothetical protein